MLKVENVSSVACTELPPSHKSAVSPAAASAQTVSSHFDNKRAPNKDNTVHKNEMDEFPYDIHTLDAFRQRDLRRVVLHTFEHQLRCFQGGNTMLRDAAISDYQSHLGPSRVL